MQAQSAESTQQTIYVHESANHAAGAAVYLPATGFSLDGAREMVLYTLLGVVGASATVQVTVQHADYDADGSVPEAGDFADATDDSGNVIQFSAPIAAAGDQLAQEFRVNADRLYNFVRIGLTIGGTGNAQAAVLAVLHGLKYSDKADANLSAAELTANKSAGFVVKVPTFAA